MKRILLLLVIALIECACYGQIINRSSPQAQGLILNYRLNEQGGNIAIPGVGTSNGTLTNGAYFKNGFCYLDGSNDIMVGSTNIPGLTNSNVLTISFWFTFISHTSYGAIFTKSTSNNNNSLFYDFGISFSSTSNRLQLGRNGNDQTTTTALTANTPYFITCEIGESRAVLYINGVQKEVLAGVATGNNASTAGRTFNICTTGVPSNMFIKDVRIYNRALSVAEVQDIYLYPNKLFRP